MKYRNGNAVVTLDLRDGTRVIEFPDNCLLYTSSPTCNSLSVLIPSGVGNLCFIVAFTKEPFSVSTRYTSFLPL